MSSLRHVLPKPRQFLQNDAPIDDGGSLATGSLLEAKEVADKQPTIPKYGHRQNFKPRHEEDFGDGGAYPEIHIPQYPLGMGKSDTSKSSGKIVPLQTDASGRIKYEAVLTQGQKDKVIYSQYKNLVPKDITDESLAARQRPSDEKIKELAEETAAALSKAAASKLKGTQAKDFTASKAPAEFFHYTPAQPTEARNGGDGSRIIKMIDLPVDPLEPPKHKHKRVPGAPPSPPPPVLHSPPRKVTKDEQDAWKIPPAISSWKNPKGFTVPLDMRTASDGRSLQEVPINDNFAKLAESLYAADRLIREEIEMRSATQRRIAEREKEAREEELRKAAHDARQQRRNLVPTYDSDEEKDVHDRRSAVQDRRKEIGRQIRQSHMGEASKAQMRDADRDVSERIALGMAQPTAQSSEMMYDQRLFNQTVGLSSGFRDDEGYDFYDKPLFATAGIGAIYQPRQEAETGEKEITEESAQQEASKIKGVDRFEKKPAREGPVQFEKDEDPFGLDAFLAEAKKSAPPIQGGGTLHAASASGGTGSQMRESLRSGDSKRTLQFAREGETADKRRR